MKIILFILSLTIGISSAYSKTRDINLALEFYSSQRAWRIGDLITVVIEESTMADKKEKLNTEKSSSAHTGSSSTSIDDNVYNKANKNILGIDITGKMKDLFDALPSYNLNSSSKFEGKGDASSSEVFKSRFTARVTDVLDNGVLVIRGERMIILKNEKVNMVLSGLVRTRDIESDNTVLSTRLADAHIIYENGGDVTNGTKPGFFWRLVQFFNPF
jgi:flagellar L-ring protein precursor FlgH